MEETRRWRLFHLGLFAQLFLVFGEVLTLQLQDNKLSATLDSPSQKAFGIKCDNVVFENNQLIISVNKLNAEYKGTLENDTIKGTFTQGIAIPLNLTKSTTVQAEPKRPQKPKPPFPYYTEEVKKHQMAVLLARIL